MLISIRWGLTKVLSNRHLLWSLSNWNALQRRQNCCCCLCICVKRSKSVRKREMRRENHNYIISVWLFILHSNVRFLLYFKSEFWWNSKGIAASLSLSSSFQTLFDIVDDFIKDVHRYTNVSLSSWRESTQITSQQQIDIETEWQI